MYLWMFLVVDFRMLFFLFETGSAENLSGHLCTTKFSTNRNFEFLLKESKNSTTAPPLEFFKLASPVSKMAQSQPRDCKANAWSSTNVPALVFSVGHQEDTNSM